MLRSYPNPNRQAAPVWMPLRKPRARITADMGEEGNAHFDHIHALFAMLCRIPRRTEATVTALAIDGGNILNL